MLFRESANLCFDALDVHVFIKGALLGSSSSILDQALEDGYWDSTISAPTLQLLDGVIGAYSSDSIVSSEEIGDDAAKK